MSNSSASKNSNPKNGIEFTFNTYRFFPGTFIVEILYNGIELAAYTVNQNDWLDKEIQYEMMIDMGVYVRENIIKPLNLRNDK